MAAGSLYNGRQKRAMSYDTGTQFPAPEFAMGTATLTSAAAVTLVNVVPDAQVGPDRKFYLMQAIFEVTGATAWTDGLATKVTLEDTDGVDFMDVLKAALTGDAVVFPATANVTVATAFGQGAGGTAGKGLQISGDGNFAAGSDIKVTVFGLIA